MATITTPAAGVSPYQAAAAAPTVLRAGADGSTVVANAAAAATVSDLAATNANTLVVVSGQAALNSLITTSQPGVFDGANVTINLEEQNFNTTNQVTSTINSPSGGVGEIQYNSGANSFASNPYLTFTSGNVVTPGIRTNGYFYGNGAPFIGGGNAAIGNFVFSGDTMSISDDANISLTIQGNSLGNNLNQIIINPTSVDLYAFNSDPYSYAELYLDNGNTEAPIAQIIVDGNSTPTQTWTFDSNGNTTFPTGGTISNYPGGTGVNTDSWFVTPNNGTGGVSSQDGQQYIQINDDLFVEIGTSYGTANASAWTFGRDGNFGAPGNISTNSNVSANFFLGNGSQLTGISGSATLPLANGTSNIDIATANGNVTITANGSPTWTFKSDGNLTLPTAGNIVGAVNIIGNGTGNVNVEANGRAWTFAADGNLVLPLAGNIVNYGNTWNFGLDGNLTLPANIIAINYANGNRVTGNVTFSSEIVIGTGTSNLISGLYLAPSSSSADANMYLRVRGNINDEPTHIHFDTGNNAYYNQFIGDDNKYIQLANTGNIVINSNDVAGNAAQWTFAADGNLIFPTGNLIITPDLAAEANAAVISSTDHVLALVSNGVNGGVQSVWVEDIANIGTSNIAAVRVSPVSQTGNVQIQTGNNSSINTWNFVSDGNLTLPNGAVIKDTSGNSVAFGKTAGNTGQGISSVAIGYGAGLTNQGNQSVAIGENAGANQGSTAVAIGQNAGGGVAYQNDDAVAIGHSAGEEDQGTQAIAIGLYTGQVAQGLNSIAIGGLAGQSAQGNNSIIINATGVAVNQTTANTFTVAPVRNDVANIGNVMFYNVTSNEITYGNVISVAGNITGGNLSAINLVINSISSDDSTFVTIEDGVNITTGSISSQENLSLTASAQTWTFRNDGVGIVLPYSATIRDTNGGSLAIGVQAGFLSQANTAVAIGYQAALLAQGNNSVAIGRSAGETQGEEAVAIGLNAGRSQGNYAVAIGNAAGANTQGASAVAIGSQAGAESQGIDAVAIGAYAGNTSQGNAAVAIGRNAGNTSQRSIAVAIGSYAGNTAQGNAAVAVGASAGYVAQGNSAVAVGESAGESLQGDRAVAIGAYAGTTSQGNNSIIINATGAPLDQTTANTFTVAPVRNDVANIAEIVFYNTTSKEITYGNTISVTGNITGNYFTGNGAGLTDVGAASVPGQTILPTIQTITVAATSGVGNAGGGGSAFANVTVSNVTPVTEYGVIITSGTSSEKYKTGALGSIPGTVKLSFTTGLNSTPFTVYAYVTSNAGTYYSNSATGTSGICLLAGTQIALSDGTHKAIEDITYADKLLSWDFDRGCYAETTAMWIKRGETGSQYNLLTFSDGTTLRTFDQHRIFNKQAGAFTYPMTAATPVGTVTVNEHGQEITLINKQVIQDTIEYYNVITDYHMNLFSDSVLTSCRFNNIYPITDMKFAKDGRTLRTRAEFENVEDRFFHGLRLAEQTIDIETVEWYVNRLLRTEVPTHAELAV
jgi:hypothetical protein